MNVGSDYRISVILGGGYHKTSLKYILVYVKHYTPIKQFEIGMFVSTTYAV